MTAFRNVLFIAYLIALPVMLLALAALLFGGNQSKPVNPFLAYSAWMPGAKVPSANCDRLQYGMPRELNYVYCELDNNPDFTAVRIMGAADTITTTYFYPRHLTYGELVNWYGYPTRFQAGRVGWYATWPRLQMAARKSMGRYTAPVIVAWFREEVRKK